MYTFTPNNKCQHWHPIFAAVSILSMHVVHDLNDWMLILFSLCTVHEQDSVVVRHERTSYMCAIAHMLYSTYRDKCIHYSRVTCEYFVKFLEQLY